MSDPGWQAQQDALRSAEIARRASERAMQDAERGRLPMEDRAWHGSRSVMVRFLVPLVVAIGALVTVYVIYGQR